MPNYRYYCKEKALWINFATAEKRDLYIKKMLEKEEKQMKELKDSNWSKKGASGTDL